MDLLSIGEFARLSRLSPKALRLYDELELLPPARVDPDSGYRFYELGQLDRPGWCRPCGRSASRWRRSRSSWTWSREVPPPTSPASGLRDRVGTTRRAGSWQPASSTGSREGGRTCTTFDTRDPGTALALFSAARRRLPGGVGARKGVRRPARGAAAPHAGRESGRRLPDLPGEVSDDSDGPVEWCRPIPSAEADELVARFPELTLRSEPAHQEAFVPLGTAELTPAHGSSSPTRSSRGPPSSSDGRASSVCGSRTCVASLTADSRPDLDFAVPVR